MGFRLSWLCVVGKAADRVFHDLGFRATGEKVRHLDSELTAQRRPDGSCIVIWYDDRTQLIEPARLRKTSSGAAVVACHVHEGIMHSYASGWRDGVQAWSVEHVSDRGKVDLAVGGTPPAIFPKIRDDLLTQQKTAPRGPFQVDCIWEIPVELCWQLTQFRHDRVDDPFAEPSYEVLTQCDSETSG